MIASNPTEGNPHTPLMLGGILASGGVVVLVVFVAVCCLGKADKSEEGATKRKPKYPTSSAAMEAGKKDTIKSVDVDSNPTYTTTVNSELDLYEDMYPQDQEQAQAKIDEELYVNMEQNKDSNFEYLSTQDVEQGLIEATTTYSPSKDSRGSLTARSEVRSKPAKKDDKDAIDEDEDGYVTYNPDKPLFQPTSSLVPPRVLPKVDDGQIYQNTSPIPSRKRKHCYVNDVDKLVREIEAKAAQEKEENEEKEEKRNSYCNVQEWQGTASKEQQELDELDRGLYVNNLDALMEAAKNFKEQDKKKTLKDAPEQRAPYVNDLFATLEKVQKEKMPSKEVNPESLYENSDHFLLSSSHQH